MGRWIVVLRMQEPNGTPWEMEYLRTDDLREACAVCVQCGRGGRLAWIVDSRFS